MAAVRLALLLAGTMAVTGGYTYLRNAAAVGNPIFPAPVTIAGVEIQPGWEHATIEHRKSAPEFFIDIPHFLTQRKELFGPFFPFTMLPAALLVAASALLAGCSTPSVITLNDGREIQATDTPAAWFCSTSEARSVSVDRSSSSPFKISKP